MKSLGRWCFFQLEGHFLVSKKKVYVRFCGGYVTWSQEKNLVVDPSHCLYLNYYTLYLYWNFGYALPGNVSSTEGGLHDHVATMTSIDPQTKQPQRKKKNKISKNSTNPHSHQKCQHTCVFARTSWESTAFPPPKKNAWNYCLLQKNACLVQQSPVLLDKDFVAPNPMVIVQSQRCPNILGLKWPVDPAVPKVSMSIFKFQRWRRRPAFCRI